MSWFIELSKFMAAFAGLGTATVINIHIRHIEEEEE